MVGTYLADAVVDVLLAVIASPTVFTLASPTNALAMIATAMWALGRLY